MSTRANVIIKDAHTELYFYRHSDGYPECTGANLRRFVEGYKAGFMRDNAAQSAGWLIIDGHVEYLAQFKQGFTGIPTADRFSGWKVGAYEPTTQLHGDVEYVYIVDLEAMTLSCRETGNNYWDNPTLANTQECPEFPTVSFKGTRNE